MHQRGKLSYKVPLKGSFMGYEDWHFHSWHCVCTLSLWGERQQLRHLIRFAGTGHFGSRDVTSVSESQLRVLSCRRSERGDSCARSGDVSWRVASRNRCRCQNNFYEVSVSADGLWSGSSLCCCSTCPPSVFIEHTHTHRRNTLVSQVGHILPSVQVQQFAPSAYINSSALINHFHLMPLYTSTTLHF